MPLKTWDTKADWDAEYDLDAEWKTGHPANRAGVRVAYDRAGLIDEHRIRAAKFAEIIPLTNTKTKILILGCGFGWTVEALNDLGFDSVVGVDTSAYILSELATDTNKDIYKGVGSILNDEGNFKPQIVITEHLIESYTDAELATMLTKYASVNIYHLVLTPQNSASTYYNLHTLEEWKALFPNHTFIEDGTWRIA